MRERKWERIQTGSMASRLLFLFLFLAIACTASTQWCLADTTVSASLDPARFPVDGEAALNVTVKGSRSADIQLPAIDGLTFQERGKSAQIQIINGSYSSSTVSTFLVEAEHPGTYTIPPISIFVDGGTQITEPITFEVTQAGSPPANRPGAAAPPPASDAGNQDKLAFLRISEIKATGWTGEVIPLQIKAYFRQGIKVNLNTLPTLKGDDLVMPQLDQKPRQTEEEVNGTTYSVLTWETSLSAVKEGRHSLSVMLEATLLLPHRTNPFPGFGGQDLFQDDMFQDFFGRFKSKHIKVASRPVTLTAKPLPTANRPHDFSGAIGHFNLSVQAQPTAVEVGDPITLKMTLAGSGNFDRVEAPAFPETPQWKTYPPSAAFKPGSNPTRGRKDFEQAIVVKDRQVSEIPPLSFVFFDPDSEKYVTLTNAPIPITVKSSKTDPAAAPSAPASPTTPVAKPTGETKNQGLAGLAPIHLQLGKLQNRITPLYAKTWFDILLVSCALLLLAVFLWKLRLRYLHNNPEIRRKKEMSALLAENLVQIKEAADHNDSGRYLAACRKAIQEMLGHHWRIEPSTITLADLQARLPASSGLILIFAAAEQGAYANHTLTATQMRQYSDQIAKELAELQ